MSPATSLVMRLGAVRAICFDLDNTLWEIEPVLARAERILADWLEARYPRIPQRFSPADMFEVRATLLREQPRPGARSHLPAARDPGAARRGGGLRARHGARGIRAVARGAQPCVPYRRSRPGTRETRRRASGSPRSAMAMPISGRSASRTISRSAARRRTGMRQARCARLRGARRGTDTESRGNPVCRRRSPRRCRRSAQRWHANGMGESRRARMASRAARGRPCDRRPRRARGTGSRAKL